QARFRKRGSGKATCLGHINLLAFNFAHSPWGKFARRPRLRLISTAPRDRSRMARNGSGWKKKFIAAAVSSLMVLVMLAAGEVYCRLFTCINFLDYMRGV